MFNRIYLGKQVKHILFCKVMRDMLGLITVLCDSGFLVSHCLKAASNNFDTICDTINVLEKFK